MTDALKLIRATKGLIVADCGGVLSPSLVFTDWVDEDWFTWGLSKSSPRMPATAIRGYELVAPSLTAPAIFQGMDLAKFLTPAQLITFLQDPANLAWMRKGGIGNFFPIRVEGAESERPVIAVVGLNAQGLNPYVGLLPRDSRKAWTSSGDLVVSRQVFLLGNE